MTSFTDLLQQGATHAWLFFPSAILLGAMHGLEPGHSKTMMAAFIIAVRGTIPQAILLGLSAALSHSLLVWMIAGIGLYYGSQINLETAEPYFQLVSAVIIAGMAGWMLWRTRQDIQAAHSHAHGHHHHEHDHSHPDHNHSHRHEAHEGYHDHEHSHDHDHHHEHTHDHEVAEFQDAHERAHASEIEARFAGRQVTTAQIVLFGITGGLMPCPAAITVLIICLQLKQLVLGFALVAAFSFGLALTMVTTGVLAAWSVHHAGKYFRGFGELMRKAPYVSAILLFCIAFYLALQAWHGLSLSAK